MAKMTYAEFLSDRQKNPNKYRVQQPQAQQRQTMENAWDRFSAAQAGVSGPQTVAAPGGLANQQISFYNNAVPSINAGIAKQNVAAGAANQRISFLNNMVPGINREIAKQNINGAAGNQQVSFFNNSVPGMNREIAKQNIQADAANQRITFFNNAVPGINGNYEIKAPKDQVEQEPVLTPYETYMSAPKEQRHNVYQEMAKAENAQDYINQHWEDVWKELPERKKEAEAQKAVSDTYTSGALKRQEEAWAGITSNKILQDKHIYKGLLERPDNYNDYSEDYDRELYDAYYGKGAYDTIMRRYESDPVGARQDWLMMVDNLKELWRDVDSGAVMRVYEAENEMWNNEPEFDIQQANSEYYGKELREIERQEANQTAYNALMEEYEPLAAQKYFIPEYDRGQAVTSEDEIARMQTQTDDVNRIYSFLGGGVEYTSREETFNHGLITNEYNYAMAMNETEKGIFMGLCNKAYAEGREPTEAKEFLEGLKQSALLDRYSDFEKMYAANIANEDPVSASLGSLALKQANTYLDIPRHIAGWLGDKSVENPNSHWYLGTKIGDVYENTVAENLGGMAGKVYRNVMNTASNMIRAIASPGSSKLAKSIFSLGGFFLQVDQEATARYLEDYDYETASILGAVDGLFEVAEEFLPFETMLGSEGMNLGLAFIVNGLSEMGQEFTGATALDEVKSAITGINERNDRVNEILHNGFYYDDDGNPVPLANDSRTAMEQAILRAGKEKWNEAIESGLAGLFGGTLGGVYGPIAQFTGTGTLGKNTVRSGIEKGKTDTKSAVGIELVNKFKLVEAAEKMADETESKKIAAEIRETWRSGKRVNYRQFGKLVRSLVSESNEYIQGIVLGETERIIQEDFERMGVKKNRIDDLKESAVRLIAGTYTEEDIKAMVKSKALKSIIKKYSMADQKWNEFTEAKKEIEKKSETLASVRDVVDSLMNPVQEGPNKFDGLTKDATVATQEDLDSADGDRTNNYAEAIVQGTISDITGITVNKVKDKPAQITITTADGRTVDASEAQAVNMNVAKIIALAQKDGGRTTSTKMLNTLLKYAETTDNMPEMMREAQKIRWAVIMDRAKPKTSLSQNVAAEILQGAREDFEAAENERLKYNVDLKPGQGRARFGDAEYGTKEFNDALKGLNSYQRREAQIVAKMAKSAGLDLEIINDSEMDATFGKYAGGARIMVNLAGTNSEGSYHSIVVSLGHEITHMLEENSREGYAALRKYVLNTLEGRGFNLQQRIQDKMDTYEHYDKHLDIYGAIYEVVAEGCDQILTSREAIRTLMKDDPSLFGKIKEAVDSLLAKIRDAMASITGSASYEAKALMGKVDEIAKLWSKAFEEVKGVKGTAEDYLGVVQGSIRDELAENIGIKPGMSDAERYDALNGKIIVIENATGKLSQNERTIFENMRYTEAQEDFAKLARRYGLISSKNKKADALKNRYIPSLNAVFSNNNMKESLNKQKDRLENLASLMPVFRKTFYNAIPIIIHSDRYLQTATDKTNVEAFMYLLGAYKYKNTIIPVQFGIKKYNDNGEQGLYVVVTTKEDADHSGATEMTATSATTSSSKISIEEIIDNVNTNDQDILVNIPSGFLNNNQKLGKRIGLKRSGESIRAKAIQKNKKTEKPVNMTNDRIDNAIKKYGDSGKAYIAYINPADFVRLTAENVDEVKNQGRTTVANEIRNDESTPYLLIDFEKGRVVGQDGIQRMSAFENIKAKQVAVLVVDNKDNDAKNQHKIDKVELNGVNGESANIVNLIPVNEEHRDELKETYGEKEETWYAYSVRDDSYMAAVERGDMETAQRLVDEAAKAAGYTELKYHGTYEDFNVFDYGAGAFGGSGLGFYFGSDLVADRYANYPSARRKGRVIRAYLKTDNIATNNDHRITADMVREALKRFQLTEEEAYKAWPGAFGDTAEEFVSQFGDRDIMYYIEKWAWYGGVKEKYYSQYEGLDTIFSQKEVLDNMRDIFKYDGIRNDFETVVWDNRLIKSADPVTYDDNGNVIPLSERFNRENEDIRYSVRDDSYMDAVNSGDLAAAQRIVDQAAKENGYTEKVYHGTPTGGFTVFRGWSYFTKDKGYADRYNHASASSIRGSYDTTTPMTYELYMNPGKVFDTRKAEARRLFNEARMEYGMTSLENMESGLPDWTDGRDLIEFIEDRGLDYDTILLDEGADGGYGEEVRKRGISYLTKSNRVKSAEAVTYDNDGNVIPPSKRFDEANEDIRFSMRDAVEVRSDGLIAVHNLTEQNLLDTLAEGGFTAPSIAVIRAKMGHSKYGDISVIFNKDAIDPRTTVKNKVYGTDAWTPTRGNAQIETKLNYKVLQKARDAIRGFLSNGTGLMWRDDAMNWINRWLYEDQTTDTVDEMVDRAYRNDGMIVAYELANGRDIDVKKEMVQENSGLRSSEIDNYNAFLNKLEEHGMLQEFMNDLHSMNGNELIDKYIDIFRESGEIQEKAAKAFDKNPDGMSKRVIFMKMRQAGWFQEDGREIKVSEQISKEQTVRAIRESIDRKSFDRWVKGLIEGALGKRGVYNGGELFTYAGNRRSFEALHDEPTAENIVRAMYKNHEAKGGEAGGATGLMAKGSKEYRNISEIRADKERLQMMDEEEYRARIEKLDVGLDSVSQAIAATSEWSEYTVKELLIEAAERYAKNTTKETIARFMAREGVKLTDGQLNRVKELMDTAREMPTGYFEAKPERVVGFDEIYKVILPADADSKLKAALDKQGIAWEEYDGTDEDRLRALNEQEDAKFSVRDEMDYDVKHWMMSVNENSLQTEAEKVLLRQFKDLNMKEQLYRKREEDYRKRIQALESRGEENLDKDAKYELQGLRVRLANATKIKEQTQAEMGRITSSEGYGRMMRDQNRIFNDFMYGRTQAEVTDAVERLEKSSREIEKIIRENQAAVSEMEKSEVIQRLKKALGKTTIDQAAADLKKAFSSTWTRNEIKTYLEPILVKLANGESIESDVATLAGILIESDSRNTYENLSALRGLTIRVGRGMLKELRAQNSSIKEIRARLAGTGITVVAAKEIKNEFGDTIGHESSTLEQDIESLREEYPGMPEFGNDKDALWNFVAWVEGMKRQSGAQEFYDERLAEAMATIMQKVIGTASGIYIPAEARAQAQVLELVEYVKTLQARTEAAERTLEQLAQRAGQLHTEGLKAAGMANTLTTNVNEALEYFNTTAKLAVAQAKQNRQNQIIDQLKSDFAKKMAKSNEEWRNLIERDRNARAQAEQNRKYRNQIRTVLKRAYNKLRSPKGMDNVPEYMQGLARELIGTFVDNDLAGGMRFTDSPREALQEIRRVLDAWDAESGKFNLADLNDAEEVVATIINQDLMTIYDGIAAINSEIRGKNKLDTLQQRGAILQQIQEATSEIWSAIRAENTVQVQKRRIAVEDQAYKIAMAMGNRQAREWTGKAGNAIRAMRKAIVSGNMTPEYFFRALKNAGLTDLWENYHEAENRNGLELAKAKAKLAEIAEKYGYETWDTDQKVTLTLASGHQVKMTVGQLMSLYATWKREMTLGPDISQHLAGGGFFAEQDTRDGILGREVMEKRAHRISVTKDSDGNITGSPDMAMVESMLTKEQVDFVNEVVAFMSNDMSELGNEASMAAYGIKLYKEGYYFPFQMWDGVRSRKSNDSGSAAAAQDRAFHPSFSKSRKHGANNALVIGDFMRTVTDHVAGMINYATMGLANESLQKTLNTQLKEEYGPDEINKRNIWAMMEEAYGRDAVQYLRELQQQLNGGAVRTSKTIADKAITLFRKNAVAGSLSVAFQQPLSYIRAAMMISPRYLTQALAREYWQGSYKELMAHSGVAVIKDMGRFDMNAGQSAREYLTPDGLQSRGRRIWNGITEYATILPELMDRWTWTRMWVAVKAEQHKLHPDMDMKSDAFLDLCGERFNEIMRRTQVYDSTLVKSANMRSDKYWIKSLTSFMAEPTVTLNVLTDSVRSAVQHEQGAGRLVRYAAGTFILSAIFQAAIKAVFSSGRSPDDKKTWLENFLNRFGSNMISELDPLNLIPGYNDLITLLKKGELSDDAMGAVGKIWTSTRGIIDVVLGNGKNGTYRDLEDSVGQVLQLFTGLPAKNIMREVRAIYNWTLGSGSAYAQRPTSGAVLQNQLTESLYGADNLIGWINKELGDAGYETNNAAYYERIYQAKKEGRNEDAQNYIDFLLNGRGVKQSTIDANIKKVAKADEDASASETAEFMMNEGADAGDYIKEQLKNGEIDAKEATTLLKKQYPDKSDDDIFWMVDRIEYQKETGNEASGQYYRFYDAMETNKATDIQREVKTMLAHGMKPENIKKQITTKYKPLYLEADNKGKTKIRDEIHKAYKALGYSAEDADKVINKWK